MRTTPAEGLEVFLTVARRGSFRRAAAELGVTSPAVSQHVRKLEERLRVPLFARTTRRVALTEAGRRLYERCWPAWEELRAAVEAAGEERDQPSGTLRLNVPRMAIPLVLDRTLPEYCARYPRVKVEVRVDDGLVDLLAGGFDAGIRLGSMVHRDMVAVALTPPLRTVIVGSPKYLRHRGTPATPEDLRDHDCIGYREIARGGLYRWELRVDGRDVALSLEPRLVVDDTTMMVQAALRGVGLAYLFDAFTLAYEAKGRLVRVLDRYCIEESGLCLYFPARSQVTPKLRAFIDTAKRMRPPSAK